MRKITIIAAMTDDLLIGANNKLPWHLPADMQHFKQLTWGKPIIMGRKTYEAIGKPLPGRRNIIISRNNPNCPECEVYPSLQEALAATKDCEEVMIIGGAEIYQLALPLANTMYLTFIHHTFYGDTYFPQWDENEWQEIDRQNFLPDEINSYAYSFVTFQHK